MIPFNPKVVSPLWNPANDDEMVWWPRCVWIDPGLSSGYCVVWFDPWALLGYGRTEVRTESRRSGKGRAGGAKSAQVTVGGRVDCEDLRPGGSARAVLAWQAGMVRGLDDEQCDELLDLISRLGGKGLVCGIESFVVQRIDSSDAFLAPVRLRAILQYQLRRGLPNRGDEISKVFRKPLLSQSPSEAKTTITDQRLRLWDFWTPGPDHPRDATKHSLLHLRKLAKSGRDAVERFYGWESGWADPFGEA